MNEVLKNDNQVETLQVNKMTTKRRSFTIRTLENVAIEMINSKVNIILIINQLKINAQFILKIVAYPTKIILITT